MATTPNDQATLTGNFKDRYAPKFKFLFEQESPLTKIFKFSSENKLGNKYHQPVDLANEQGISYAAPGVLPSGASYLPAIAGQSQDAQVEPYQIHGRGQVAYTADFRSDEQAQAFLKANKIVMKRMTLAAAKRHEWAIINGQRGWGQITANVGSATSRAVVVTEGSWASGAFIGSIGMPLDLYSNSAGVSSGTKVSSGTTNSSDAIRIAAINYATRTLTLSTPNGTDQSLNVADTWIFPETASITKEMPGLAALAVKATTYQNIDPAAYPEWKGQTATSVGTPDFAKVLELHAQMAPWFPSMGLSTITLIPPKAFAVMNADQAALREYDVSYKEKGTTGFRELEYRSDTGVTKIVPHPLVLDSQLHVCVPDEVLRIGSTEHTFITRAKNGGEVFVTESSDSPAGEMRDLIELALFVEAPRHNLLATGLTYSTS